MQINNGQLVYNNNLRNNSYDTKLFKKRNNNNKLLLKRNNNNNYQNSTKETTPIKENKDEDSMTDISEILNKNKKHLNFKEIVNKIPGIINNEPNFLYDQMLYNKTKIKKVKELSKKIKVLKIPINDNNNFYNNKEKKWPISDRNNNNKTNTTDITCCFFGK